MLSYKFDNEKFVFSFSNENGIINFENLNDSMKEEYFSQIILLQEFLDNGFAKSTNGKIEIEQDYILQLEYIDKKLLSLPDSYNYSIYIESIGSINQVEYYLDYTFCDFYPNGNILKVDKNGPLLLINGEYSLLSKNQYKIIALIDQFKINVNQINSTYSKYKLISDIKELSDNNGIELEDYLNNLKIIIPDKLKLDIQLTNNRLEIKPCIINENDSFANSFDMFQNIKEEYTMTDQNNQRVKVIFNEQQRNDLKIVKDKREITNKTVIKDIIENPESLFNNEVIDLEYFSNRVKEIGYYKPKFYSFVCPYRDNIWIPGISIKDKIQGEKRIRFKTRESLTEFEDVVKETKDNNLSRFKWKNTDIEIKDAEKFIKIAKSQFDKPTQPYKSDDKDEDLVLIIKENAEVLEYFDNIEFENELNHTINYIDTLHDNFKLKTHQIEGISWLQSLFNKNLNGCLLADDMGLGKTLQVLYFIEWHSKHKNTNNAPYLIVCPISLIENWEMEYKKYFKECNLNVEVLNSRNLSKQFNSDQINRLQQKRLYLINYETVRACQFNLCAVDFAVVVLDEAQKIKTPGIGVTSACKALKADFNIAITGTPVENSFVDLWCIMDFTVPGLLGIGKDFASKYQNPLRDSDTDIQNIGENVRNEIGFFIKRRFKKDVLKELPPIFDNDKSKIKKIMPQIQYERYKHQIELAQDVNLIGINRRNQILKSLQNIRDISDHPYLVGSQIMNYTVKELIESSAKVQSMLEIIDNILSLNEKVIIFSDKKKTQQMIQKIVSDVYKIEPPTIINGDTPIKSSEIDDNKISRQRSIDRFQDTKGFNIIIMSQLAAGVGLNVTGANHVIHFSRPWNPAKEEQATARAYRIGQTKDVYVYYPMSIFPEESNETSFDLILDNLLEQKKSLSTHSLFPTEKVNVEQSDIIDTIFSFETKSENKPIKINDIDNLNPDLFEALIASIYQKLGNKVILTPFSNDKGADVVVFGNDTNYLIQVKQSKSQIGNDAIKEIYTCQRYYEQKFNIKFELMVMTNNDYTNSSELLAQSNNIILNSRNDLINLMNQSKVTFLDLYRIEQLRESRI